MDYIYFVFCVAALGLVVAFCWRLFVVRSEPAINLEDGPIPPFKRTVGGLSEKELEHIRFQSRIDVWQRDHEVRRTSAENSRDPVDGRKYEFVPSQNSRAETLRRTVRQPRFRHQFELLN